MLTESFDVQVSHPIDNTTDNGTAKSFIEKVLSLEAKTEVTSIVPMGFDEDNPNNDFTDPLLDNEKTHEHQEDAFKADVALNDDIAEANAEVVFAEMIELLAKRKRGAPKKGPHQCQNCGKVFQFLSRFKCHFQQYHGEKNLICPKDGCISSFAQAKHFKEHLKVVHKMNKNEIASIID